MTLVCEDAYSKLVEVVTVADVSDEDRVVNTFLNINMSNSNNLNKFELPSSHARVTSIKFTKQQ